MFSYDVRPDGRLNLAALAPRTEIYGPGHRFAVWVQGCRIRCPGCWNREMWSARPRHLMTPEDLASRILQEDGLDGITLLGGEPLHQAPLLIRMIDRLRGSGLSVMVFTGYELEDLTSGPAKELLDRTDLLVCGPYVEARRDTSLVWRGSTNQRVLVLGPRYTGLLAPEATQIEVVLAPDGRAEVRGFPEEWVWEALGSSRTTKVDEPPLGRLE